MSTTVSITEAKARFGELLEQVEAGEEVVVAKRGKPVAVLTAVKPQPRKASLVSCAGSLACPMISSTR